MDLIKFFIKDDVTAVGLSKFKEKKEKFTYYNQPKIFMNSQIFKTNNKNNIFIM